MNRFTPAGLGLETASVDDYKPIVKEKKHGFLSG
jgi:hypothetical protein